MGQYKNGAHFTRLPKNLLPQTFQENAELMGTHHTHVLWKAKL